jgi:hypothetical protein
MTKEERAKQRLAIRVAKDIIAQLDLKSIKPKTGTYVRSLWNEDAYEVGKLTDSKKQAKLLQKKCDACALGSMFLSLVKLDNDFDFDIDIITEDNGEGCGVFELQEDAMRNRLHDVFSRDQLDLIETAFETWGHGDARELKFGKRYKTPAGRLRAICRNIIENEGVFKP